MQRLNFTLDRETVTLLSELHQKFYQEINRKLFVRRYRVWLLIRAMPVGLLMATHPPS